MNIIKHNMQKLNEKFKKKNLFYRLEEQKYKIDSFWKYY